MVVIAGLLRTPQGVLVTFWFHSVMSSSCSCMDLGWWGLSHINIHHLPRTLPPAFSRGVAIVAYPTFIMHALLLCLNLYCYQSHCDDVIHIRWPNIGTENFSISANGLLKVGFLWIQLIQNVMQDGFLRNSSCLTPSLSKLLLNILSCISWENWLWSHEFFPLMVWLSPILIKLTTKI